MKRAANGRIPYLAIPGMELPTLLRVLRRNRFAVEARSLGRLGGLALLGALNSLLARCEARENGAAIAATPIVSAPIFVLGHWRSGTTYLHNLLAQDRRFACPTTYQCLFPHHFCYSQRRGAPLFDRLGPGRRPMDGMAFSACTPHEEEFALAGLAAVSPYLRFLFPRGEAGGADRLDPARLSPGDRRRWEAGLLYFVRALTFSRGRRLILKSPANMCRIGALVKLFPGAKFVHIVRHPYAVYASTLKLWHGTLRHVHLQRPAPGEVERIVLEWYAECFARFERDRRQLGGEVLHELTFEALEREPLACLERLYGALALGGFEPFRERVIPYLASIAGHRTGRYTLDRAAKLRVQRHWGAVMRRYGYPA